MNKKTVFSILEYSSRMDEIARLYYVDGLLTRGDYQGMLEALTLTILHEGEKNAKTKTFPPVSSRS